MENILLYLFLLLPIITIFLLRPQKSRQNTPPSPPSLPIIGHLHLLSLPLHQGLARLTDRYGPVLLLKFGPRSALVVSSPQVADDCLTTNDVTFANRPHLTQGSYLTYDYTTLSSAPNGPLWRNLRRFAHLQVFSTGCLNSLTAHREEEARMMVKELCNSSGQKDDDDYVKVNMKTKLQEYTFNILIRIMAGKRYAEGSEEGLKCRKFVHDFADLTNAASPEDFFPLLGKMGYRGPTTKPMIQLKKDMDEYFQELIEERRRKRDGEDEKNSMIDTLLSMQKSDGETYNDSMIKAMILTLLTAGAHTMAGSIEWAMSLLLNHPQVLAKVTDEIDAHVGVHRTLKDSDLPELLSLNNVIKENLRLYPAGPLLAPHESSEDCTVAGYKISRGTMLFVNVYTVHRDPKLWPEPTSFRPERFEEVREDNCQRSYFPFGIGRRGCPGEALANRAMGLALASLVQCFEWKRIEDKEVDMSEAPGLVLMKAKPLEALCKPREIMVNVIEGI